MKIINKMIFYVSMVTVMTVNIASNSYAISSMIKPTTVVGFNNTGESADDNVNIIITKSLINFLSKIPNSVITSYDQIDKTAEQNGYWKKKKMDKDQAVSIAQTFDTKQLIAGEYRVDRKKRTIDIKAYVYDVITGELKLSRSYTGSSGVDLFDTIENMTRNISGLLTGKDLRLVDMNISVSGSRKSYRLFINGRQAGVISEGRPYEDKVMQDENFEFIIRQVSNDQELFRENRRSATNQPIRLVYQPMGNAVVKNVLEDGVLYLDGKLVQPVTRNKTVSINNLRAYQTHQLELRVRDGSVKKDCLVEEGETSIVIIGGDLAMTAPVNYHGIQPLWNLLLPGIGQFQARDPWMGTLFLAVSAAGAGLMALSEISFSDSFDKYLKATTAADAENYYRVSETWRNLSITGIAVWSGAALLSVLHIYIQPDRVSANLSDGFSFNIACRADDMEILINRRF